VLLTGGRKTYKWHVASSKSSERCSPQGIAHPIIHCLAAFDADLRTLQVDHQARQSVCQNVSDKSGKSDSLKNVEVPWSSTAAVFVDGIAIPGRCESGDYPEGDDSCFQPTVAHSELSTGILPL